MKIEIYTGQSPGWSALYRKLPLVLIMTCALFAMSCASNKSLSQSTQQNQKVEADSGALRIHKKTTLAPVPESKANLKITLENLTNLPPGAVYTDRQGQATVKVTIDQEVDEQGKAIEYIYITGTCDSLQRVCEEYSEALDFWRTSSDQSVATESIQIEKTASITVWGAFKWCSIGVLIGIILTIITIKNLPRWQK